MEQLDRAKRYLRRLEKLYAGIRPLDSRESFVFDDDVISLFTHCHKVSDNILKFSSASGIQTLDSYIQKHKALRICADLVNGSRDVKLTKTIFYGAPPISPTKRSSVAWLFGGTTEDLIWCRYLVLTRAERFDALDLAKECINLWEIFFDGSELFAEPAMSRKKSPELEFSSKSPTSNTGHLILRRMNSGYYHSI